MCTVCGKTYTQLGHLSIHKLSHEGMLIHTPTHGQTQTRQNLYYYHTAEKHVYVLAEPRGVIRVYCCAFTKTNAGNV